MNLRQLLKSLPLVLVVIGIIAQSAAANSHGLKAAFSKCSIPSAQSDQQVSDNSSGCGGSATKVNKQTPANKNSAPDSHHCAVCCAIQHSFIDNSQAMSLSYVQVGKLNPLIDSLKPLILAFGILRPPTA